MAGGDVGGFGVGVVAIASSLFDERKCVRHGPDWRQSAIEKPNLDVSGKTTDQNGDPPNNMAGSNQETVLQTSSYHHILMKCPSILILARSHLGYSATKSS